MLALPPAIEERALPGSANSGKSLQYRRKAAACGQFALWARSDLDRKRLIRMQESWNALADNEDWLDGVPSASFAIAPPVRKLS
jgi:hypothetical protein